MRSHRQAAATPALAAQVTARAAQLRRHRLMRQELGVRSRSKLIASGIALKAADTGRVLMLQRTVTNQKDSVAGKWEFAGGHIEPARTASTPLSGSGKKKWASRCPTAMSRVRGPLPTVSTEVIASWYPKRATWQSTSTSEGHGPRQPAPQVHRDGGMVQPRHRGQPSSARRAREVSRYVAASVKAASPLPAGKRGEPNPFDDFDAWFDQMGPQLAALVED